jgi:formylglycine-generating enzyme required for sulfatase activity
MKTLLKNHVQVVAGVLLAGTLLLGSETTGGGSGGRDPALAAATKENPYVNSVGMKLVPVPGTNVLMATTEVTVDQYKAAGLGYRAPRFAQTGNHPVVGVSWKEAKAYCAWLSKREGKKYRLPTDHEWSCAVGIGHLENPKASPVSKSGKIADVYPWGRGKPSGRAGNYMGQEWNNAAGIAAAKAYGFSAGVLSLIPDYNDGVLFTAPVGSYAPNNLGIYDLGGNVWEWCEDKYGSEDKYIKNWRVQRGGSWNFGDRHILLSSFRGTCDPEYRSDDFGIEDCGFRVVCEER